MIDVQEIEVIIPGQPDLVEVTIPGPPGVIEIIIPGPQGATGEAGSDGHSPVLTWDGDQIAIDGTVSGPNLTGPKGDPGADGSSDTAAQVLAKLVTVDGTGSELDADTLDGNQATAFAASTHHHDTAYAALNHNHAGVYQPAGNYVATSDYTGLEILTKLVTVDGTGSELDADTLDGNQATAFAAATHNHDSAYATTGHNHNSAYAALGHNHDAVYVPLTDTRLSDARTPLSHNHADNKLAQANTHESADTDSATAALHHTVGTGANQAAAGNHQHEADYVKIAVGHYPSLDALGVYFPDYGITNVRLLSYVYTVFLPIQETITLDQIGTYCKINYSGAMARLGIYAAANKPALYPTTLILDAGEVDLSTTGLKTRTINQVLNPGNYFLAIIANSGNTYVAQSNARSFIYSTATQNNTLVVSASYGNLPDPFGTATLIGYTSPSSGLVSPGVFVRRSA